MALLCIAVAVAGFASAACAQSDGNWDPMHKLDEIGNPAAQQTSPQPFGPAVVRLTNSQFSKEQTQNKSSNSSEQANSDAQTLTSSIVLGNTSAVPDPANPGSPVEITAVFGNIENITAYAIIKDSNGVQVGNTTLERSSGGEYIGTWTAAIALGIYNASIIASAPGASKTFNDALQIEILESGNATSNNNGKSTYTKLG